MIPIALVRLFGAARQFFGRRSSLSTGLLVSSLALALCGGAKLAGHHRTAAIPAALATRLATHAAATVAETLAVGAAIHRASAESLATAQAVARARAHRVVAMSVANRADSLASAGDWKNAYDARNQEVGELLTVDALKDTALVAAEQGRADVGSALQLTEIRAARADTLLGESVRLLRAETGSRLAGRVRPLLYFAAFVGGAVVALKVEKG
jgi:hypothetical protein